MLDKMEKKKMVNMNNYSFPDDFMYLNLIPFLIEKRNKGKAFKGSWFIAAQLITRL